MLFAIPPRFTYPETSFCALMRLWFTWCMALLLAWASPVQATVTTGTISFHSPSSPPDNVNGITFSAPEGSWLTIDKNQDDIYLHCPSCPNFMISPNSGSENTSSSGTIKAVSASDTFNLKGFKVYDWGGVDLVSIGAVRNTKLTVTPYSGNTAGSPIVLNLAGANTLQTFTFDLYNVTRVDIASDESFYFAITDLEIEIGSPPPTTAPTLTGLTPNSGPTTGGTSVTLTGTNLSGATSVTFGGTAATSYTVNSATQITATAPAGSVGTVNVTVTTPGGTSATSGATLYAYYPPLSTASYLINVSCHGASNGTARVSPTGGVPPYTYSWAPSGGTAATATGLAAGTYTVTVTDASNATASRNFTITQPSALITTGTSSNPSTNGGTNGSATVTPSGGTPPYTYSWTPSGGTAATATGLAAGTYTVTITDANACQLTQSFTLHQPPSAPTAVTATAGNGSASVSFTAPSSNGGSPITGYSLTSSPAGGSASCQAPPATSCTVTGLTNGTSYTFTVTATNSAGTSAASAASNSVTPKMAQSITFAQPANQRLDATLTLSATASSGLPVSFSVDATTQAVCQINGTTLSFSSVGSCTVHADQAGNDVYLPATQVSHTLTVHTAAPGAPTNVVAMAGNTQAQVTFAAPHDVGTSPITGYEVTIQPGGAKVSGSASPIVVPGLSNGVTYTFTVAAKNATDTGAASSPSNAVTPQGVIHGTVPTPTRGTGSTGTATASAAAIDPTLDPNCRLAGAMFASEVPPGYLVSYGSFEFLATNCQHGVIISLTYPQPLPQGVRFMKFGPPSFGAASEWMDWTSQVQLSADRKTATYSVLDNGAGDSDQRVGLIADPVIPAALSLPPPSNTTSIPTLNEWGVMLLSAFLGLLGWSQTRRRYL